MTIANHENCCPTNKCSVYCNCIIVVMGKPEFSYLCYTYGLSSTIRVKLLHRSMLMSTIIMEYRSRSFQFCMLSNAKELGKMQAGPYSVLSARPKTCFAYPYRGRHEEVGDPNSNSGETI